MVERGKLVLAAQCLERAADLAPQQDYVHRHLAIVRSRIDRMPQEEIAAEGKERFDESLWAEPLQPQTQQQQQQQAEEPEDERPDEAVVRGSVHNHLGSSKPQQQQAGVSHKGESTVRCSGTLLSIVYQGRIFYRTCLDFAFLDIFIDLIIFTHRASHLNIEFRVFSDPGAKSTLPPDIPIKTLKLLPETFCTNMHIFEVDLEMVPINNLTLT